MSKVRAAAPSLSFVTLGELMKWAEARSWARHNRLALDKWLSNIPILHSSREIASIWGTLSAAGLRRGRPRPQNDTWIAAVALVYDLPLATLNFKDFADFEAHHGLRLVAA